MYKITTSLCEAFCTAFLFAFDINGRVHTLSVLWYLFLYLNSDVRHALFLINSLQQYHSSGDEKEVKYKKDIMQVDLLPSPSSSYLAFMLHIYLSSFLYVNFLVAAVSILWQGKWKIRREEIRPTYIQLVSTYVTVTIKEVESYPCHS